MKKHWQKTLTMTRQEWNEYILEIRRKKIEAWSKAGARGFPPSVGICTVANMIELARQAGYDLPQQAETVLAMDIYQLAKEAMIAIV